MVIKSHCPTVLLITILLVACRFEDSPPSSPELQGLKSDRDSLPNVTASADGVSETNDREIIEVLKIPRGTPSYVHVEKSLRIDKWEKDAPEFNSVLADFSIATPTSSPEYVVLSGKVMSCNAGFPEEAIPIFFGSPCHHPCLAALTDMNGQFRFRVWLGEDRSAPATVDIGYMPFRSISESPRRRRLTTPTMDDAILYVCGYCDERMDLTSSYTRTYSIKELLAASNGADTPPAKR